MVTWRLTLKTLTQTNGMMGRLSETSLTMMPIPTGDATEFSDFFYAFVQRIRDLSSGFVSIWVTVVCLSCLAARITTWIGFVWLAILYVSTTSCGYPVAVCVESLNGYDLGNCYPFEPLFDSFVSLHS